MNFTKTRNYKKKKKNIDHVVNKFVRALIKENKMTRSILNKLPKYQKKYNLSEIEVAKIIKLYEKKFYNQDYNVKDNTYSPNTLFGRTLGSAFSMINDGIRMQNDKEYPILQDILKLYAQSKFTHNQVALQSLNYKAFDPEITQSIFDRTRKYVSDAIHPLFVALFLPKIKYIEELMIFANIGEIIQLRYEQKPITTSPNFELHYYLVNNPEDAVCSIKSPMQDLLDRFMIQIHLWKILFNMRDGKFFEVSNKDIILNLETCKLSIMDNPDQVLFGDEGLILKRLLNVFASRTIMVKTIPIQGINFMNNLMQPIDNIIRLIPYVTIRLNDLYHNLADNTIDIEYFLNNGTTEFYFEYGSFIQKKSYIVNVNSLLVIYIARKILSLPAINPMTMLDKQYNTILSLHTQVKIFDNPIHCNYDVNITLSTHTIELKVKSVIAYDYQNDEGKVKYIKGYKTYLTKDDDTSYDPFKLYIYDPKIENRQIISECDNFANPYDPDYENYICVIILETQKNNI